MGLVQQLLAMMRKDMRLVYRRPVSFVLVLLMPLVLIAVTSEAFGFVFGDTDLKIAVVDLDHSHRSQQLIARLSRLEGIELRLKEWRGTDFSQADAAELFEDRRQFAALVIPKGFGQQGEDTTRARLSFYVDPVQMGLATVVRDRIQGTLLVAELLESLVAEAADQAGADRGMVKRLVDETLASPPTNVQTTFVSEGQSFPSAFEQSVPGFSVMFGFWLAGYLALMVNNERHLWGSWTRSLVAPVPRWVILGSRVAAYVGLGVIQFSIMLLIGRLAWGLDLGDSPAALGVAMVAIALISACFGLMVSSLIRDNLAQQTLINLSVIVLGAVGGALVPTFLLPDWMERLSPATPHFWALSMLQDIIIRGRGVADVLPQLGVLLGFAATFFSAGLLKFRFVG